MSIKSSIIDESFQVALRAEEVNRSSMHIVEVWILSKSYFSESCAL